LADRRGGIIRTISKNTESARGISSASGQDGSVTDTTNDLIPLVYDELRRLAAHRLSHERPGQILESAALVNEAYLRLMQHPDVHWKNKRHFFVAAAEAMRRILIENARRKKCKKRGGEWHRIEVDISEIGCDCPDKSLELLHEVLDEFSKVNPESAELVKLRFYAGLSQQQCADVLGISKRTVNNRWVSSRAWLRRAIQADD